MKKSLFNLVASGLFLFAVAAGAAVNINTANKTELTDLQGVGPATATAIVKDRKANGDYKSVDELTRVKGIGNKTVDGLRDNATTSDDED